MVYLTRRIALQSLLAGVATATTTNLAHAAAPVAATMYKQPDCDCCDRYAQYLGQHGFAVRTIDTDRLIQIQHKHGVPQNLQGCHALLLGGYVIDGLVPASVIRRLLREQPSVAGITLPGMPFGAPGMDEPGMAKQAPFVIYAFGKGTPFIYTRV